MKRKACPKCQAKEFVKAGFNSNGKQRLKCKSCKHEFVQHETKTYPKAKRELAKKLYLEGLGFRAIGRILNVSNVTVLNWIRQAGEIALSATKQTAQAEIIELDELHTYIQKNSKHAGCGLLLTVCPNEFWPLNSAVVVFQQP